MNTPIQKIVVLVNSLFALSTVAIAAYVILSLTVEVTAGWKFIWSSKDFWLIAGFAVSLAGMVGYVCIKTINAVHSRVNQGQFPLLLMNGVMLGLGLLFGLDAVFAKAPEWSEFLPLIAAAVALMNLIFFIATPGRLNET